MRVRWFQRREPLAVVFSGGANLGAFQVGAIDAFARRGLRPDLLVGTSVGALNAAFWAFHPELEAGSRLLEVWRHVDGGTLRGSAAVAILPHLLRRRPLFATGRLEGLLRSSLTSDAHIEDAPTPLRVIATRAADGKRRALDHGPVVEALLASSAIPGLFSPREFEGELYMDGGLVANCDLDAVVEAGIRQAIVVDAVPQSFAGAPADLADSVTRGATYALARQTELELALHRRLDLLVVRLNLAAPLAVDDFTHTAELFGIGRAAGEAVLETGFDQRRRRVRAGTFAFPNQPTRLRPSRLAPLVTEAAVRR